MFCKFFVSLIVNQYQFFYFSINTCDNLNLDIKVNHAGLKSSYNYFLNTFFAFLSAQNLIYNSIKCRFKFAITLQKS